jgi:transposase InsO family protein
MTQGKIERWHQTLKNRILLENYFLPVDLEAQIEAFVADYDHLRYHESISNLTVAPVWVMWGKAVALPYSNPGNLRSPANPPNERHPTSIGALDF